MKMRWPTVMGSGVGQSGTNRVIRGGSWNNTARNARAAYRNGNTPDDRNNNLGFRLARALGWTGWSASDQTDIVSVPSGYGEQQMGAGVAVGAAERPSNPHRWPALPPGVSHG